MYRLWEIYEIDAADGSKPTGLAAPRCRPVAEPSHSRPAILTCRYDCPQNVGDLGIERMGLDYRTPVRSEFIVRVDTG
jgi:hypothetical protein